MSDEKFRKWMVWLGLVLFFVFVFDSFTCRIQIGPNKENPSFTYPS